MEHRLTKNPEFLFNEFEINTRSECFVEHQAPVSQLIVMLNEMKETTKVIDVNVLTPLGPQYVGPLSTTFKFRGVRDRLAHTALLVTKKDESTIVYANRASDAIDIALKIANLVENETTDPDVQDLVDFVKVHVHARYALVATLPKGAAFHYGRMPHLLRSQVESLLRRGKLNYVVCTSTLLQGINLPARNIVILAPRKGNGNPMRSADFWNLAGRAGRMRETFNMDFAQRPADGRPPLQMRQSFHSAM